MENDTFKHDREDLSRQAVAALLSEPDPHYSLAQLINEAIRKMMMGAGGKNREPAPDKHDTVEVLAGIVPALTQALISDLSRAKQYGADPTKLDELTKSFLDNVHEHIKSFRSIADLTLKLRNMADGYRLCTLALAQTDWPENLTDCRLTVNDAVRRMMHSASNKEQAREPDKRHMIKKLELIAPKAAKALIYLFKEAVDKNRKNQLDVIVRRYLIDFKIAIDGAQFNRKPIDSGARQPARYH